MRLHDLSFIQASSQAKIMSAAVLRIKWFSPNLCNFTNLICKRTLSAMKPSVYVTRPDVQKEGLDLLKEKYNVTTWHQECPPPREELLKAVVGKDAIFCNLVDKIDKTLLDAAGPNLKVVTTMSVGYDHIDLKEARQRGIKLGYTPDVLTDAVAELTVGLVLATARRFFESHQEIFNGGWRAWAPAWMTGPCIRGKTIGIVGYGRIGHATATILKGFGVKKIYYTSRSDKDDAKSIGAERRSIEEMLPECDFVISTIAFSPQTDKFINARLFSLMKKSAVFVNTSRGGVVDQDALINALETGQIRAAGLDVMIPEPIPPDHPLLKLKNCVVIPHIGSASIESRIAMSELCAHNIVAALEGKPIPAEIPL